MTRGGPRGRSSEARLLGVWRRLDAQRRSVLLEFAEFLAVRAARPPSAHVITLRPQSETVVHAVRRLNASYPKLERAKLLQAVGDLLSQHLVDGRAGEAVIDDLEALYAAAYATFLESR